MGYLLIRYEPSFAKIDRVTKGFCISLVFLGCLSMAAGSGGCLNPAMGMAEVTYSIALFNRDQST